MRKWLWGWLWCLAAPAWSITGSELIPAPPAINADAYFLMDFQTGEVLVEHNADLQLAPASLTKLMTAYILAQEVQAGRLQLTDNVPVSRNAWSQNPVFRGSSLMWIEPGKPVSVAELERGIVISSGNDATVAIAEHIGGTEEAFAALMNQYAEQLGLTNTHFENSHGLPHPDHLSTARDLATLAAATIRDHPERYTVYKEQSYTYNDITQYNRNHLLREDDSVDGLKTGYTSDAGYGLVASALRDGMRLVSVVLGSASANSRKSESRSLLNYGFRFFETVQPLRANEALAETRVWKGQTRTLSVGVLTAPAMTMARSTAPVEYRLMIEEPLSAPIAIGDVVGTIELSRSGNVVAELPLQALNAVEPAGFFARLWDAIVLWFQQLLG